MRCGVVSSTPRARSSRSRSGIEAQDGDGLTDRPAGIDQIGVVAHGQLIPAG